MHLKTLSALACCAVLVASCTQDGVDDPATSSETTAADPTPGSTSESTGAESPSPTDSVAATEAVTPSAGAEQGVLDGILLASQPIATLVSPTDAIGLPGTDEVYISTLDGGIWIVPSTGEGAQKVLDVTPVTSTSGEGGLLALAFANDGSVLYLSHTRTDGALTLASYTMQGLLPDGETRDELVVIDKPTSIHNAGDLTVTPDGFVWWSTGDGGPADEPPSTAQDPASLLGKILRLDVSADGAEPEIWAMGLRNPWRFSVDPATGDVWIGDVGRYDVEEIDRLRPSQRGANLQWPLVEGDQDLLGSAPAGSVAPLLSYPHDGRCAVTGGVVYRGSSLPSLQGTYLYGDLCDGKLRALTADDRGVVIAERVFDVAVPRFVSLGYDGRGEVLLVSLDGDVSRLVAS